MIESDHSTTAIDLSNRTMVMESGPVFVGNTSGETFDSALTMIDNASPPRVEEKNEDLP
jgi:hypothetical protein